MTLIRTQLLTPAEAANAADEYRRYLRDGPPYDDTPNGAELLDRDRAVLTALNDRASEA